MEKIALAVHGGAGTILKSEMTADLEREYRLGLEDSLNAGWEILRKNGSSLDAVEAATIRLENFPLFNAGRGAVFTHDGRNELDASIMSGSDLAAGAVAFVKNIKNPIGLARLVLERTEHILLAGDGAEEFARQMRVETADDAYFFTEQRYQQLLKARETGNVQLDHAKSVESQVLKAESQKSRAEGENRKPKIENRTPKTKTQKPIGTVGAVACDAFGNLAAATSTGGMTNKQFGRVGDTPLIGAGTYADNRTCAASCTGHGEFFMKTLAAYDVAARMKYKNLSLAAAADEVIENLRSIGGEGGLIAVDRFGNVAVPFNSDGMYRGFVTAEGGMKIEIYC